MENEGFTYVAYLYTAGVVIDELRALSFAQLPNYLTTIRRRDVATQTFEVEASLY